MIKKISKIKSWFFEKINRTDTLLARPTIKKRAKIHITEIRNLEKGTLLPTSEK